MIDMKLAVIVGLVLVFVPGPAVVKADDGCLASLGTYCNPSPLNAITIICNGLCIAAGYDSGVCSTSYTATTSASSCTCSGANGNPAAIGYLHPLCENGVCLANCAACGFNHNECTQISGGGELCTCSNV